MIESVGFSSRLFPILPPEITDKIVKWLSVRDLKICRRVSINWCNAINESKTWQKSTVLRIPNFATGGQNLSKFLEHVKKVGTVPFRQYKLRYPNITGRDFEELEKFFSLCGSSIETLEINNVVFSSPQMFRRIFFCYYQNLRNLKLLRVDIETSTDEDSANDQPEWIVSNLEENRRLENLTIQICSASEFLSGIFWKEFLSCYSGIKSLTIDINSEDFTDFLTVIANIRHQDAHKLQIEHLK